MNDSERGGKEPSIRRLIVDYPATVWREGMG